MNFKKNDILISMYGSIGVYDEPNGIPGYFNCLYAIDKYAGVTYRSYFGLKNPRLATKAEIKQYLSALKESGKNTELQIVKRLIVSKDEF